MNGNNIDALKQQIEQLQAENKELIKRRDAYKKKSEYLSKELEKATGGQKHMSGLEIAADLALTLCVALLITITAYTSGVHDEGFFELIKNAFAYIFK